MGFFGKQKFYGSISASNHSISNSRLGQTPGFISKLFFCWLTNLIRTGYKRELIDDDIFPVLHEDETERLGDRLEKAWNRELEKERTSKRKFLHGDGPHFSSALIHTFNWSCFKVGFLGFLDECIGKIAVAYCLGRAIESVGNKRKPWEYYIWILGMILISFLTMLIRHQFLFHARLIGMRMASASTALIFRKSLKLSQKAFQKSSPGQIINYLSNDLNGFIEGAAMYHYAYLAPIQSILTIVFLWLYIGVASIVGLGLLLLYIPFQVTMGKLYGMVKKRQAHKTDLRMKLISELINAIRTIKMYTWEDAHVSRIQYIRKEEMARENKTQILHSVNRSMYFTLSRVTMILMFSIVLLTGDYLTARNVFVTMFLYSYLSMNLTLIAPKGVAFLFQTKVSCKRIQEFLVLDEFDATREKDSTTTKSGTYSNTSAVQLANVSAKWIESEEKFTLYNINCSVESGKLLIITGPVGSGKSSILQTVLKELPILTGQITQIGSLGYASQHPWIFNSSIRENILFGNPYRRSWYESVVNSCSLRKDFELLPFGDNTLAGEQGSSLSGGQKARINLARAIYNDADIYLLDDPLSAVDANVGTHIVHECIKGILKSKAVVLVTHQTQFVKEADSILILDQGKCAFFGTLQDFGQARSTTLQKLLHSSSNIQSSDFNQANGISTNIADSIEINTSMCSYTTLPYGSPGIDPVQKMEISGSGVVTFQHYKKYFNAGGNSFTLGLLILSTIVTQILFTASDYWLSLWTTAEENQHSPKLNSSLTDSETLSFLGRITRDASEARIVFEILVGLLFITSLLRGFGFFRICYTASVNLYQKAFQAVIRAPMSFFETTQSGIILNRFSKDLGIVDSVLPLTIIESLDMLTQMFGATLLVLIGNVWLIIPAIVLFIYLYLLRRYYSRAAIAARRLETVAKSSVYSHVTSTLLGIQTIRAAKAEFNIKSQFYEFQDRHTSNWYVCLAAGRWLGVWADMGVLVFTIIAAFALGSVSSNGSFIGLCITSFLSTGMEFQFGIRQLTEADNQMISVERIIEYSQIKPEPPLESLKHLKPSSCWPISGRIQMKNLSLKYGNNPPVLKNISIEIEPKEKVGIVGRTGAGKSSLVSTLFRLHEPTSGELYIDGVNVLKIGLHDLRSKISIIPQEPHLFPGTLRSNLDPFRKYSDQSLRQVLEDVQLVHGRNNQFPLGLETTVFDGGSNFSVGERQLICLGRAILRQNKILILDEATASVDKETDALIQSTIRRNFKDCTVLTIAHRLNTVLDSNRILVLDQGIIQDFDEPSVLLRNPSSSLYRLAEMTGESSLLHS